MKKFNLFWLLCFFPFSVFAATDQSSLVSYYYDVNNICGGWCREKPENACCSSNMTVNSLANMVSKTDYSLRGFSASPVEAVSQNNSGLSNLVVTKGGVINDSISGDTNLYAAWAQNCATITGGTCDLQIGDNGSVTYRTTCSDGYDLTSGAGTYNPVCTAQSAPGLFSVMPKSNTMDDNGNVTSGTVASDTVGLNLNGGSLSQDDLDTTYSSGDVIGLTPTSDTGSFCAWCPESDTDTGTKATRVVTRGASSVPDGCMESIAVSDLSGGTSYFAVYTPSDSNTYTVNYVSDGLLNNLTTTCTNGGTISLPRMLQKTGSLFYGWLVNGRLYNDLTEITCNSDTFGVSPGNPVIIRADWREDAYLERWITLHATCNGTEYCVSHGEPPYIYCQINPEQPGTYGCHTKHETGNQNIINQITVPTASGKIFDGYYYNDELIIDSTGALVYGDWTNFPDNTSVDIILEAHWTDRPEGSQYHVTWDCGAAELRSGTTLPTDSVATYGASFGTINANNYCYKQGYRYTGWLPSGETFLWHKNTSYTWRYAEDKTFVAQWEPKYFYITYDCGKGEDSGVVAQYNEAHAHFDSNEYGPDAVQYGESFTTLGDDVCELNGYEFDKWEVYDDYAQIKIPGITFVAGDEQVWNYSQNDGPNVGFYPHVKLIAQYKKSGESQNWVHYIVNDNGAYSPSKAYVASEYNAKEQLTEFWCQTNNNLSEYCGGCYLGPSCYADPFSGLASIPSKGATNYYAGHYYGDTQVINHPGNIVYKFTSGGPYEITAKWLSDFTVSYDCDDGNGVQRTDTAHYNTNYTFAPENLCTQPSKYYSFLGWNGDGVYHATGTTQWTEPHDVTLKPVWQDDRDWERIYLYDLGSLGVVVSQPVQFWCPRNQTQFPECEGCFKTKESCEETNRFTGLTVIPQRLYSTYNGHVHYRHDNDNYSVVTEIPVLRPNGQLITPVADWLNNITPSLGKVHADWTCQDGYERTPGIGNDYYECTATSAITSENQIEIFYTVSSSTSGTYSWSYRCTVGESFTLPNVSDVDVPGYTLRVWNSTTKYTSYEPGQELMCNRETLGGAIGSYVTLVGIEKK